MNLKNYRWISTAVFGFAMMGCASGNCRQAGRLDNTQAPPPPAAGTTVPAAGTAAAPSPTATPAKAAPKKNAGTAPAVDEKVVVYKYDGSLQCGMGKAVPVTEMEKELVGIQVFGRENKPDGLMHIQVCGQPTGNVNAYTIPAAKLADAEKRGFRKWNF